MSGERDGGGNEPGSGLPGERLRTDLGGLPVTDLRIVLFIGRAFHQSRLREECGDGVHD